MVELLALIILIALFTLATIIAYPIIAILDFFKPIADFIKQNPAVEKTLLLLLVIGVIAFFWWAVAFLMEQEAKYEDLHKEGNEERRERFWETINLPDDIRPPYFEGLLTGKESYIDWLKKPQNKKVLE